MGVKLEVLLEPENLSYSGGDEVTGFVKVTVDAITACKAILARVRGFAETLWGEEESYSDTETYFENTITVWSGASYGDNLMPGEFCFPFSFRLPDKLPSTYEGAHGHIRYAVEARNDVQWGATEHAIARFTVKAVHDLNEDPKLAEPLPLRTEETVCCCCCEEGPVIVSLTAEKGGYVAGEYILLTGEITNRTSKVIECATISLHQTITFHASAEKKKQRTVLQKVRRPGFGEGGTDVWLSVPIHIPDYAVALDHCTLITAEYKIQVSFCVGGYWNVDVDNTFKLGTVPVGKLSFALDGDPSSNIRPSAPPLEDPLKPPSPIMEQPRGLPAPSDPLIGEGKDEEGHVLGVL